MSWKVLQVCKVRGLQIKSNWFVSQRRVEIKPAVPSRGVIRKEPLYKTASSGHDSESCGKVVKGLTLGICMM